jgi:hypothetical protein
VDDRHDLYGSHFFEDYEKVMFAQTGWNKVLEQTQANWVLVQKSSALETMLEQTPGWKLIHGDGTAALFHHEM